MSGVFWARLTELNRRDWVGLAAWTVCALLVGPVCLPVMAAREVWQWRHFRLQRFEWEDVVRYGLVIVGASCVAGAGGILGGWLGRVLGG